MKNTKKILAVACAMALSAAIAVGGTLAYLTSQDSVTNTFTVGNVKIVLDEADTDQDENTADATISGRDKANDYKLYPGKDYIKDPTITVAQKDDAYGHNSDSEDCWLFVKVENGIEGIEAEGATTIAAQMAANGWTALDGVDNVYWHEVVSAGAEVEIFASFQIAGTVDNDTLADYADAQIVVTAYAVQAEGFNDAATAWGDAGFS